ncbi:hypothetical protein CANINC_004042 [Pichia inconspicua]|uniref:FYVE-type domain-containing protein n=1 Tax=Pichia inconspicua TaxID=52247 RepID=A0A4T0WX12_9ASCO|nr:hypothetical protein CANINC_004042 [[Candida] inconspicua]
MSPMSPRTKIRIPTLDITKISENKNNNDIDTDKERTEITKPGNVKQINHQIYTQQQQLKPTLNDPQLSSRSYNMTSSQSGQKHNLGKTNIPLLNKDSLSPNKLSSKSNTNLTTLSSNSSHMLPSSNSLQSYNLGTLNNSYNVNQGRFAQTPANVPKTTFNTQPELHSHVSFQAPERSISPFRDPMNMHVKQINDQQRPMYTPAVLRVMKNDANDFSNSDFGFDVNSKPSERPRLMKSESTTSIRSTASSIREYWNYLTGSNSPIRQEPGPSRKHWKPDSSRFNCTQCGKVFNYLTENRRKHHCRYCGDIFCGDCLKNYIYLDKNAEFTLFGSNWDADDETQLNNENKFLCKVCHVCFQKYEAYMLDHTKRDHNLGTDGKDLQSKNQDNKDSSVDRQNLPVDWDWSSF